MSLELVQPKPEHIPEVSRIIFEAFRGIQEQHRFPLDIPSAEVAGMLANMIANRKDVYGVVAMLDGKVVGSNFTQLSDPVSGVGPITVDPSVQGRGIGRALMQHVVDWSLKNHGPMVRLLQEAYNMASLSLYTSLGFTVVEPVVLMEVKPATSADPSVRPLTSNDLSDCDALCRRVLKVSRKSELAFMIAHGPQVGSVPHGRFQGNRLVGQIIPGFFGYGVAESADDLIVMAAQTARVLPPTHRLFVPTRNGQLFRRAMQMGFRCLKPMSIMAMGPYEEPMGPASGAAWSPSIAY